MKARHRFLLSAVLVGLGYALGTASTSPNELVTLAATGVTCLLLGGLLVWVANTAYGPRQWKPFQERLELTSHKARIQRARANRLADELAELKAGDNFPQQKAG